MKHITIAISDDLTFRSNFYKYGKGFPNEGSLARNEQASGGALGAEAAVVIFVIVDRVAVIEAHHWQRIEVNIV